MNILITGAYSWTEEQMNILKSLDFMVDYQQFEHDKVSHPEIYDIVVCNNLFKYNNPELFRNLRMIQLVSAGIDESLSDYASKTNIALFNARGVYSIPIAETVIMQILNIYKKSKKFLKNQELHVWEKDRNLLELTDKTALIIGYGSIGKEIAKRLKAFGVHITTANRIIEMDENTDDAFALPFINRYAQDYDIIIVSIASCEDTYGLVGKDFFDNMKQDSVFINISRGNVIDEDALIDQIKKGKFRGVALDVMKTEPLDENNCLWDLDGLYITPHNSFISDKIHTRMFNVILDGLLTFKEGQ